MLGVEAKNTQKYSLSPQFASLVGETDKVRDCDSTRKLCRELEPCGQWIGQ